jgi:hypothetical protein
MPMFEAFESIVPYAIGGVLGKLATHHYGEKNASCVHFWCDASSVSCRSYLRFLNPLKSIFMDEVFFKAESTVMQIVIRLMGIGLVSFLVKQTYLTVAVAKGKICGLNAIHKEKV